MTATDAALDRVECSALVRVETVSDPYELERAWNEGIRGVRDPEERDRVLAAAGRRLGAFDEVADDFLRKHWLSQVVEEFRMRGEGALGSGLPGVAAAEMREAFGCVRAELGELRESLDAGEGMDGYAEWAVQAAARVRDLGRMAQQLRGSGLMALVSDEHAALAREFAASVSLLAPLLATVPEVWRVSRDDLLRWADAERELPRLVRSLIAETTPSAARIDMPAGTAVSKPGWDGIVECLTGNRFVPSGRSVWEVSVQQKNSDRKARDDYDKRVSEIPANERAEVTYVAVICAPWTKVRDFAREKSQSGDFRHVRAFNVDGIEEWLECAPQTTVWLRDKLGKPVDGVRLLSSWWAKWLEATSVALDTRVVLAGRDQQAEILRDCCRRPRGGVVTIGGSVHRDEILAFVAAALSSSEPLCSTLPEVLYVDDEDAARRLLAAETHSMSRHSRQIVPRMTVVVPSAEFAQHLPVGSRHYMIVPVPGSSQAEIVLEAVDPKVVAQEMEATGMDYRIAHEMGSLARMSLLSLRRCLAVHRSLYRPAWATDSVGKTLRRSLMLGSWNETHGGDQQIVDQFVGQPYDDVTEALKALDSGDAPIISTGELWHAVSPADTWMLLGDHLSRNDIAEFGEIAQRVLTEPDLFWGLTHKERLLVQYEGGRARFSAQIKRGIATTLALLGNKPPVLRADAAPAPVGASGIVVRVLKSANDDTTPKTWAAVSRVLPLLAEAAPETVLAALRSCLSESHEFSRSMFTDNPSDGRCFSPLSSHFGILNALQVLAWSPDHMVAVVDLLARMAEIDPGGLYANRPAKVLSSIMCPWMPYTSASAQDRLTAIRMLRRSHGSVAWLIMLSMLPGVRNTQLPENPPRYRDWKRSEPVMVQSEYVPMIVSVGEMLLEDVGQDPARWVDLIRNVAVLPEMVRNKAVAALNGLATAGTDESFKSTVWPELRTMLNRHRHHREARGVLDESALAPFDGVLESLRPAEPSILYGHLFSSDLMGIDGFRLADDVNIFREKLGARQVEAVKAILVDGGIDAVFKFSKTVEQQRNVGIALACADPTLDTIVLSAMDAASEAVTHVALGYFSRRFKDFGWKGLNRMIADYALSPQVVADLHRAPPPVESPWTRVDDHGTEAATEYWARATYYDIGIPKGLTQLMYVSRRLRAIGRIDLARLILSLSSGYESDPEFAEEAAVILEQWIQHPNIEEHTYSMESLALTALIRMLDKNRHNLEPGRVAFIEWYYYPVLSLAPEFSAPNMYRELATNPEFFVQLLELAFLPANKSWEDCPKPTEQQRERMLSAIEILSAWPDSLFVPGLDDKGRVDAKSLKEWVDRVRERLAEINRVGIGDEKIGNALASSPPDPNGEWPGIAVRDLLERLQNNGVERGLGMAVRNQRGATCRSPTDGGDQERHLAQQYRKQGRCFQEWPRTAAIFAELARIYEHEAGIHDREAEPRRRGLPL